MKTEVLIIGGGITGILTAYMLGQKGVSYVLIEAENIASGTTRNTTAKITAQHGLIYDRLCGSFGVERAKQYLDANLRAVEQYGEVIGREGIHCDFQRIPAHLYAQQDTKALEAECEALGRMGYRAAYSTRAGLPFPVKGCIRFENQAQCNPLLLVQQLSRGLNIVTHTRALSIEGNAVHTTGERIYAHRIILAVHFPFINIPGFYFARMHQECSYAVALEGVKPPDGAYLGVDGGKYSFRSYKQYVLLGGCGHRSGKSPKEGGYDKLLKAGEEFYPGSRELCRWSAEDCMTHDGVPYIGCFSKRLPHVYVATGFNKWGMTTAMAAAGILSDAMVGKKTEYDIFSPNRHNLRPAWKGLVLDGCLSAGNMVKKILRKPDLQVEDLQPGTGGIVRYRGKKCGVYKDGEGLLYVVDVKCPHLGCELAWNQDRLSWDCPCHGSSFDYRGRVRNGPGQTNLRAVETAEGSENEKSSSDKGKEGIL